MRIALVPSLVSPLRPAEANGPHAVVVDLARGLAARGHRTTIYAAAGSEAAGCDIVEVPVEPAAAAAAVRIGQTAPPAAIRALNRSFERLFDRIRADAPDVVSQHAFDAAAITLCDGLPAVHTLHLPPTSGDMLAAVRRAPSRPGTVSDHARRAWRAATGREIGLLRNGVRDLELKVGPPMPVALIAGRISPEKGTDVAIRAARRAGLAVLIAGDVYDPGYHAAAVAPLLRPGEWLGAVSREELSRLMARSAVLIMPIAWDEPFGLVAAEAQMAGCPVVAYRRGALPEVVGHGIGGWLVEPDDEDALPGAVARARTLDRGTVRARARRDLGVEAMVDVYERELRTVATSATSATAMAS